VHAFNTLVLAVLLASAWRRRSRSKLAPVALGAATAGVSVLALKLLLLFTVVTEQTLDTGLQGAKGYLRAAREVLALVPKRAVVGSLQTGALGYLADGCPRIVGLDGVVDGGAARAVRERTLAAYARARGVDHFADWDFNLRAFAWFSQASPVPPPKLEPLGEAGPPGSRDRFRVFRVRWLETPEPAGGGAACDD
jgi:hypothetical protein